MLTFQNTEKDYRAFEEFNIQGLLIITIINTINSMFKF